MSIQRLTFCLVTVLAGCRGEVSYNAHPDNAWGGTPYSNQTVEIGLIDYDASMARARKEDAESGRTLLRLTTPVGDINSDPIEYWYTEREGQVVSVVWLGHADGPCCAQVSLATMEMAILPGLTESTVGPGIARFECDPARGCPHSQVLTEFATKIRALEPNPRCEGQLFGKKVPASNFVEGTSRAHETARLACDIADSSDTITAIWSGQTSTPAVVPLQDRRGNEIVIELPWSMFKMPSDLVMHVRPDDVTRALKVVKKWLRYMDRLIFLTENLGPEPTKVWLGGGNIEGQEASAASITLSSHIAEQNTFAHQSLKWGDNWKKLVDLDNDMYEIALLTDAGKRRIAKAHARNTKIFQDMIQFNEKVLELLETRREGTVEYAVYRGYLVEDNPWSDVNKEAKAARKKLRKQLAWLEEEGPRVVVMAEYAREVVAASALRGWPLPMDGDNWDERFDSWQAQVAEELWDTIERQLEYRFNFTNARARLLLSNLHFEVVLEENKVRLTPHYVLASDYLTICEPKLGFAYYQSTSADQNLAPEWMEI